MTDKLTDAYPIPVNFVPGQQPTAAFLNAWADQIDDAFDRLGVVLGDFTAESSTIRDADRGGTYKGFSPNTNITRAIGNLGWLNTDVPAGLTAAIKQEFILGPDEYENEFELFLAASPAADISIHVGVVDGGWIVERNQNNRIGSWNGQFPSNATHHSWAADGKRILLKRAVGSENGMTLRVTYPFSTNGEGQTSLSSGVCMIPGLAQLRNTAAGCSVAIGDPALPHQGIITFPSITHVHNPQFGNRLMGEPQTVSLLDNDSPIQWSVDADHPLPTYVIPPWIHSLALQDPARKIPAGLAALWEIIPVAGAAPKIRKAVGLNEGQSSFTVIDENTHDSVSVTLPVGISLDENKQYIVTFAGTSLSESIGHNRLRMQGHTHDGKDESALIPAESLKDRFDPNYWVFDSESSQNRSSDNYFPQYIHRAGYNPSNTLGQEGMMTGHMGFGPITTDAERSDAELLRAISVGVHGGERSSYGTTYGPAGTGALIWLDRFGEDLFNPAEGRTLSIGSIEWNRPEDSAVLNEYGWASAEDRNALKPPAVKLYSGHLMISQKNPAATLGEGLASIDDLKAENGAREKWVSLKGADLPSVPPRTSPNEYHPSRNVQLLRVMAGARSNNGTASYTWTSSIVSGSFVVAGQGARYGLPTIGYGDNNDYLVNAELIFDQDPSNQDFNWGQAGGSEQISRAIYTNSSISPLLDQNDNIVLDNTNQKSGGNNIAEGGAIVFDTGTLPGSNTRHTLVLKHKIEKDWPHVAIFNSGAGWLAARPNSRNVRYGPMHLAAQNSNAYMSDSFVAARNFLGTLHGGGTPAEAGTTEWVYVDNNNVELYTPNGAFEMPTAESDSRFPFYSLRRPHSTRMTWGHWGLRKPGYRTLPESLSATTPGPVLTLDQGEDMQWLRLYVARDVEPGNGINSEKFLTHKGTGIDAAAMRTTTLVVGAHDDIGKRVHANSTEDHDQYGNFKRILREYHTTAGTWVNQDLQSKEWWLTPTVNDAVKYANFGKINRYEGQYPNENSITAPGDALIQNPLFVVGEIDVARDDYRFLSGRNGEISSHLAGQGFPAHRDAYGSIGGRLGDSLKTEGMNQGIIASGNMDEDEFWRYSLPSNTQVATVAALNVDINYVNASITIDTSARQRQGGLICIPGSIQKRIENGNIVEASYDEADRPYLQRFGFRLNPALMPPGITVIKTWTNCNRFTQDAAANNDIMYPFIELTPGRPRYIIPHDWAQNPEWGTRLEYHGSTGDSSAFDQANDGAAVTWNDFIKEHCGAKLPFYDNKFSFPQNHQLAVADQFSDMDLPPSIQNVPYGGSNIYPEKLDTFAGKSFYRAPVGHSFKLYIAPLPTHTFADDGTVQSGLEDYGINGWIRGNYSGSEPGGLESAWRSMGVIFLGGISDNSKSAVRDMRLVHPDYPDTKFNNPMNDTSVNYNQSSPQYRNIGQPAHVVINHGMHRKTDVFTDPSLVNRIAQMFHFSMLPGRLYEIIKVDEDILTDYWAVNLISHIPDGGGDTLAY